MYQYRLKFKGRDEADIYMPASLVEAQGLLDKFMKSDEVVSYGNHLFRCSDIKRVSREWVVDYKAEEQPLVELSDEKRERNIRRLRWIRTYIMAHKRGNSNETRLEAALSLLPESDHDGYRKFFTWYLSPEQVEKRELKDQFRAETFDTYYPTHDAADRAFTEWKQRRSQLSLVDVAEEVFGVSAS